MVGNQPSGAGWSISGTRQRRLGARQRQLGSFPCSGPQSWRLRQVPGYRGAGPWGAETAASRRRLQRQGKSFPQRRRLDNAW